LKKGKFRCGDRSSQIFCIEERQVCDKSSGEATCICADGWTGSKCQELIDEPPSMPPTKMPTSAPLALARLGGACNPSKECATKNSHCFEGKCLCESGFISRKGHCININECERDFDNGCDVNADCIDTEGSYECRCRDGFRDAISTLPGRQCQQINECKLGTHDCDEATQVCIDRRPPKKWVCVERTPSPTTKPTRVPTHPPVSPPTTLPCPGRKLQTTPAPITPAPNTLAPVTPQPCS
jgi:Calcium-binding EGF domain/EB module